MKDILLKITGKQFDETDDELNMEFVTEGKLYRRGKSIEFEKGVRYKGYYDTPYGAVEMEVLTNNVINNISMEDRGTVDIDYHISLKGVSEGRNRLNIEVM